jgi:uncharacterized protein
MKPTARNIHRDFAYFYLGLIIAFSFSGIFLNHRRDWNPRKYTYSSREINVPPVLNADSSINDTYIATFTKSQNIKDNLRRFSVEKKLLSISYEKHDVKIDLVTGKGKIEAYHTTPVLGQMTQLHVDTSKWWIYYSDVFGVAMLTIAFTGMFIQKGENSFWQRGWKLALIGVIFPLIFLFLLS